MGDNGFNNLNGFNLGIPNQHHNPNPNQQHLTGVPSPQNAALWNALEQRFANQVQHTQQLNQNATQMLYQSQPHLQQGLQPNQPANNAPLSLQQQLRLNPQAVAAAAAARQNQQSAAGLNPGLLGVGGGPPPIGANGGPYNISTGQIPTHLGPQLQQQQQNQQQQQQQQQQTPQQTPQQPGQFNPGQGQQGPGPQQQMGGQMPSLGQTGQSNAGFSGGQQPQPAQAQNHTNGPDPNTFIDHFMNLPLESFRNQLVTLKTKIKALEDQRNALLSVRTPQNVDQAGKVQAQINHFQNIMQQLTEMYQKRQTANMALQQGVQAGPSGQQGGQSNAIGQQPGANPAAAAAAAAAAQNRAALGQGLQNGAAGQGWPQNMTPQMAQQLGRERLQALVNARAAQQQPPQQQPTPAPPRAPSTQPNQLTQSSPQANQQNQPGQRQIQFHEFFTSAFNAWLRQRQLTLDPPRVDGQEVELHKLFLMVGALGGGQAVFDKKLWQVVGAKIGFPYFNGPLPYSKPEVAEQLARIYQKILSDFEIHWHNSLKQHDPKAIFPLPPQLQYLHPEIERLATAQFPAQQQPPQQSQLQLGGGPQPPPDGTARGPTPSQMTQRTPQLGQAQAANQQQEALMRNQPGVAFPGAPGQANQMPNAPELGNMPPQGPLQQLVANPDFLKLSPTELKQRGFSDEAIQKLMIYRNQVVARGLQARKEQEAIARQAQTAQAAGLLNSGPKEASQLTPGIRTSSALGGAQPFGLGAANPLQQTPVPPQPTGPQLGASMALQAGLNVTPEQFAKAQEKVRAAIGLFHNKRDYSSINLSHDQGILLEQSIQQTQSLLKQVAQNLVSFVILAPNDERELNQVAQTVVTLSDQAQILQKPPPEKRFIFGLSDLNQYRHHLTSFIMRVKALQSQAMAPQNSQPSAFPPGPPPQPTLQPQEPMGLSQQPPLQAPIRPPTAELPRPPIPAPTAATIPQPPPQQPPIQAPSRGAMPPTAMKQPIRKPVGPAGPAASSPSPAASTPVHQAPTPVPVDSPNTPKSPAVGSKVAPGKSKPVPKPKAPPAKRGTTKQTPKIPAAEVPGTSQATPDRPPSKRDREDDVTGPDGSAGPSGSPKRARTDPQEDLDAKRNTDIAAAKQLSIEGSLDFLDKTVKEYERVTKADENATAEPAAVPAPTIESLLQMLDQGALYNFGDLAAPPTALAGPAPAQDAPVPAPGVKAEDDADDWWWAIDFSQTATEDPAVGETPELVQSVSSQGPTPNSDGEADAHTNSAAPSAPVAPKVEAAVTEGLDFWTSIGAPEGRYYSDDSDWKWDGKIETNGEWPISYPAA
ncbi:hypothetical protein FRB90_011085 [Tulasnella sp. 427]|nr:hypothetical protein FRB90_011085 [Tulasnella sp. 427]